MFYWSMLISFGVVRFLLCILYMFPTRCTVSRLVVGYCGSEFAVYYVEICYPIKVVQTFFGAEHMRDSKRPLIVLLRIPTHICLSKSVFEYRILNTWQWSYVCSYYFLVLLRNKMPCFHHASHLHTAAQGFLRQWLRSCSWKPTTSNDNSSLLRIRADLLNESDKILTWLSELFLVKKHKRFGWNEVCT